MSTMQAFKLSNVYFGFQLKDKDFEAYNFLQFYLNKEYLKISPRRKEKREHYYFDKVQWNNKYAQTWYSPLKRRSYQLLNFQTASKRTNYKETRRGD